MPVAELVERFTALALAQDEALLMDEIEEYNRLYGDMDKVQAELSRRAGDQRRALLGLHGHRNAQVRLKAAIATLAVAPDAARQVLATISRRSEFPQAAYAPDILQGLDDGSFRPA